MLSSTVLGASPATAAVPLSATGSTTPPLFQEQEASPVQEQVQSQDQRGDTLKTLSLATSLNTTSTFSDVASNDTYAAAVNFVVSSGMMAGTSATQFSPDEEASRGIVTISMAQMSGEAIPSARSIPFEDVDSSHWYSDSTSWCMENGIAVGYGNNLFGGEDGVTWEQLATILHSYADYAQIDNEVSTDINNFQDRELISDYAVDAVAWALATGMMQAENNRINPQDTVTRGELAQVLVIFLTA